MNYKEMQEDYKRQADDIAKIINKYEEQWGKAGFTNREKLNGIIASYNSIYYSLLDSMYAVSHYAKRYAV